MKNIHINSPKPKSHLPSTIPLTITYTKGGEGKGFLYLVRKFHKRGNNMKAAAE